MRAVTIFLLTTATVSGCMPALPAPATLETVRNYQIEVEQTAGIGEPIFDVQVVAQQEGLEATIDHDPKLGFNRRSSPIERGHFFPLVETNDEGESVIDVFGSRVAVREDGSVRRSTLGFGEWPEGPMFRPATRTEPRDDSFRAQLLYSGLDGSTVRAAYREFVGDLARPAFSQELQYNLAADSTIAYRSIRIRVTAATNSSIRYRVVGDGELSWLPR